MRPGASRPGVAGLHGGALTVRVGSPPVEGAANREVLAILARALGVGRSSLALAAGARGRSKQVRVHGLGPEVVEARLAALLRI